MSRSQGPGTGSSLSSSLTGGDKGVFSYNNDKVTGHTQVVIDVHYVPDTDGRTSGTFRYTGNKIK